MSKDVSTFGIRALGTATVAAVLGLSAAGADHWPQWRGPRGDGVSRQAGFPVAWTLEQGVLWRAELPGFGASTPAVWGNAIFVTTQQDDELLLLKLDAADGRLVWSRRVGSGQPDRMPLRRKTDDERRRQMFHQLHNLASPSPVTDGAVVVVHFGNGDLAAYDFDGQQLWKRNLQEDYGNYTIWWGHANSPVIYRDLVISACMQDSLADVADPPVESYVVAHDLRTGAVRWKTARMTGAAAEENDAYTTPLVVRVGQHDQLIVMGGNQLDAQDPATGKQLWFLPGIVGGRTVTGPVSGDGLVFATQGKSGPLLAVRLGRDGQLTRRDIVWRFEQGTPDTCCPVLWAEHLFVISDGGVARCFDARTGHLRWTQRLVGNYKASPVAAEGRVYFLNTDGLCTVIAASPRFEKLAESSLDDEFLASPALAGGRLYLRGRQALWCVGNVSGLAPP